MIEKTHNKKNIYFAIVNIIISIVKKENKYVLFTLSNYMTCDLKITIQCTHKNNIYFTICIIWYIKNILTYHTNCFLKILSNVQTS